MSKEKVRRYLIFLVGLFINSLGVSFITKANLGTSPITSVPYTLSLGFPFTLGEFTFIFNLLLVLFQLILLKKNFKKEYWLQIPVTFLFSIFIDLTMDMLSFINSSNYIFNLIYLIIGCLILGFGVFVEVLADVVMLPGESFVNAVSKTFNTDFGKTKIVFDSSMTIAAGVIGLILFHKFRGVREGTIVAAFLVGMASRVFKRRLGFIEDKWIRVKEERAANNTNEEKAHNLVITIGREYGCGGRKIGRRLAEELSMKFYDRDIIKMTAKRMNVNEKEVEEQEQSLTNSLIYDMVAQYYKKREENTIKDKTYEIESELVRKAALEGNCIIVGRCADYVCRNMKNVVNVYLHADDEFKTKEIMDRENMPYEDAKRHVKEMNRKRFNHYKYYTGRVWGMASNYDLSLDTSKVNEDKIIDMIKSFIA